ncbi:histidine-type phosphatase [Herbaspirillum sp. DW155]|uniref:histidine-type phosphatase n=1 Tax=Herbaspirillum sp. DW155 TaxID=3095609 RepID=UPI00308F486C|nr:histidine-type phosphatase [Herbaspirillum sp. DW155]
MTSHKTARAWVGLAGLLLAASLAQAADRDDRQTKTPYVPRQAISSLEPVPAGYAPVFTQLLARHGSRGLTGMKSDLALYRLWQQADQEHALTPLGQTLGPALQAMLRANFLLGAGVAGISEPGYGNETLVGLQEHTELARRMVQRLPGLFDESKSDQREVVVVSSGKDRAVDSAQAFTQSLLEARPGLRGHVKGPSQDAYLLYFHRLPKTPPAETATLRLQTWKDSQAYQAYQHGAALQAQLARIRQDPRLQGAADAVLSRLFRPDFLKRLEQGGYRFSNSGTLSFASEDGRYTNTLTGDGRSVIANGVQAAWALYDLYAISAGMSAELERAGSNVKSFAGVMPPTAAQVFAEAEEAEDFYSKGPGMVEQGDVTWRMARILLQDFFDEADAIDRGQRQHLAKLRFAHAEIVIPLATLMGLPGAAQQVDEREPYAPARNGWRGAQIAPMAANLQWDMFADAAGRTVVRLLYNEAEVDFKPSCDAARISPGSHYYDYHALRACYAQALAGGQN